MYLTWESLTLCCTEYWINAPNSFLVQTHRRTDRSFGFTLRARPRNLPSHIHSADTREDRKATTGKTVCSEVFSIRAVSQPINTDTDNNSCDRRKVAEVRGDPKLLVTGFTFSTPALHAQTFNPGCKKCSSKHYFNTQHHSNSLPYWFCQIWMTGQDWQRNEPSPELTVSTKHVGHCGHWNWTCQHSLWLLLNITYRGTSSSPESSQTLQGVHSGFPTRPQLDKQLGEIKKRSRRILHFTTLGRGLPESTELVRRKTKF